MKIEEGKSYKARNGAKFGPLTWKKSRLEDWGDGGYWSDRLGNSWFRDGLVTQDGRTDGRDLISEWDEGPVRTVTRKEIVPGVYGRVKVMARNDIGVPVHISWPGPALNADELRSAAMIFSQLAEVLDENKGDGE